MVKDSKTKLPGSGGLPPRPSAQALSEAKANRLTLRMHPDILELLSMRAAEKGVSRSHLVEQILVGYIKADPRNPRLDPVGRIVADAESPLALRERSPVQLADRWRRFVTAHEIVIGAPPSADWLDDPSTYWDGVAYADRHDPDDQGDPPTGGPVKWSRRRRPLE